MSTCLGLYIEENIIKYAKVSKEHDQVKVDSYGMKIYENLEQTIKQKLPEGFQKSEFLLEHGFIDMIVERKDMKEILYKILKMHKNEEFKEESVRNKKIEIKKGDEK